MRTNVGQTCDKNPKPYLVIAPKNTFGEPEMAMPRQTARAKLNVRIPQDMKAQLEAQAAAENLELADYLRKHLPELQARGMVRVEEEYPIPYQPYSVPASPAYASPYSYNPYQQPYAPHVPDAMDAMFNDMRKLVTVKIMADMLKGLSTPEDFVRTMQGQKKSNDGGFDMGEYLKYSMIQAENDRRMMNLQMQVETAKARGDKTGEKGAMDAIAALMAANSQAQIAQSTQAQNFLQQFMAVQQSNAQQQNTLFTTALQVQKSGELENRAQAQQFHSELGEVRGDLVKAQIDTITQVNTLQLQQLNQQMEQIRNEKAKDPLTQIAALLELREKSPVYKAAFDAAFGVKEESMIGTLIPKLKELGVDKLIEKVAGTLGNLVMKPRIPSPEITPSIPLPSPVTPLPTTCIHGIPYGQLCPQCQSMQQPLEQLHLPIKPSSSQSSQPTQTKSLESQFTVKPENAIGYTNLTPREEIVQVSAPQPEVTIPLPQEETITLPPAEEQPQPYGEIPSEQQKPFTTHKGGKPK